MTEAATGLVTTSRTRLVVLCGAFLVALAIVLVHLWLLMVREEDAWARRSYENRWAFRSVPSHRGQLLDRDGQVLAHDEPTTRASIYYRRFRVYHVVGAAVHGATHWSSLLPGSVATAYTVTDGVLGPRLAARDLMSVPVRALKPGILSKTDRSALATYATTVLSVCSGMPRRNVYAAMRKAASDGPDVGIGDVLPIPRAELLAQFDSRVDDLSALDDRFQLEQQKHNESLGRTTVDPTMLEALDKLRKLSLEKRKIVLETKLDENGDKIPSRFGSLFEDVRRYFAHDVDFELAAALRVDSKAHPGIGVEPSIRRVRRGARDSSLGVMLGQVRSNDRLIWKDEDEDGNVVTHRQPTMSEDWRRELVPYDVTGDAGITEHMREEASRRYQRESLVNERSGISGMEALCDEKLTGKLGMRFIEHDSRRREHRLWSHLRVEAGEDVHLTFDLGLQDIAEWAVKKSDKHWRQVYVTKNGTEKDFKHLESALAIIDAHSGDVLALAGAPITGESTLRVPGLRCLGNGSIGSVVKPFLLLEHLESERYGWPHLPEADMVECSGSITLNGQRLACGHAHWSEGRAGLQALAASCNSYFHQAGKGLGPDGVMRALRRFGLVKPEKGGGFSDCWQTRVRGLSISVPNVDPRIWYVRRAIGYGVQSAPLYVARAYAGIATGVLPQVGVRLGEERRFVPLGDLDESLAVVRQGMARCVRTGTGDKVALPREWGVHAKTGTAEINSKTGQNNSWFAGYLPWTGADGMQLVFCAVVYRVPAGVHGDRAAGGIVSDFFGGVQRDPELQQRYLAH